MACNENGLTAMEREPLLPDGMIRRGAGEGCSIRLATSRVTLTALAVVEIPLLALILMVVAISVMVAPGNILRGADLQLPLASLCPFFTVTDVPCLFCGMTRSFMSMGGLDIRQALIFHPLGPVLYSAMLGFGAVLSWSIASRRRLAVRMGLSLQRLLAISGVAVLIIAWLIKLAVWRQAGLL
ncbi:MAG: DUF2752 domain-containing protein [Thermoleophilia bacterium]